MSNAPNSSNAVADALAAVLSRASERSVRLFSLACVRRVGHLLNDTARRALDVAEAHVNGLASDEELADAVKSVKRALGRHGARGSAVYHAVRYVKCSPHADASRIAAWCAELARDSITLPQRQESFAESHRGSCFSIRLIREGQPPIEAGSDRPPPPDAPADFVRSYEQAMRDQLAVEEADRQAVQQQANAREAEFLQSYAFADIIRRAAFDTEIDAQLKLVNDFFGDA